jgi:hypothetical protein
MSRVTVTDMNVDIDMDMVMVMVMEDKQPGITARYLDHTLLIPVSRESRLHGRLD